MAGYGIERHQADAHRKMEDEEEEIGLPFSTHSNSVESYIDWLRNELQHIKYGEIGLTFIVHGGQVKRVKEIREESCKP